MATCAKCDKKRNNLSDCLKCIENDDNDCDDETLYCESCIESCRFCDLTSCVNCSELEFCDICEEYYCDDSYYVSEHIFGSVDISERCSYSHLEYCRDQSHKKLLKLTDTMKIMSDLIDRL